MKRKGISLAFCMLLAVLLAFGQVLPTIAELDTAVEPEGAGAQLEEGLGAGVENLQPDYELNLDIVEIEDSPAEAADAPAATEMPEEPSVAEATELPEPTQEPETEPTPTPTPVGTELAGKHNIQAAAGQFSSYVLKQDGTVWSWGRNTYGQLGDGKETSRSEPRQIPGLSGVKKIAAGVDHAFAIKEDGTLWAWGYNHYAQIGDGTKVDRWTPVQVTAISNVEDVVAGDRHNLALTTDGAVYAWGANVNGQLGDGTNTGRFSPVPVNGMTGVKSIAIGGNCSIAVKEDGTVWLWGTSVYGTTTAGTTTNVPVQMEGLSGFRAVKAAGLVTLGIKENGEVWALFGSVNNQTVRQPMKMDGVSGFTDITIGNGHVLGIKEDGSVWGLGSNTAGQLGDGTNANRATPVQMLNIENAVSISAGSMHTLIVTGDGKISGCGINRSGQLGPDEDERIYTPIQIGGDVNDFTNPLANIQVAAGIRSSYVLKQNGTVWAWGTNESGQLGNGTTVSRREARQIVGLSDVEKITAGYYQAFAIKQDGTLWGWGSNYYGQLGDGTTTNRYVPIQVPGINNVAQVAAGEKHNLALTSEGKIYAWGLNTSGQLGDGTTTGRYSPTEITGISGVKSIAVGSTCSVAVKEDGTVWFWGHDSRCGASGTSSNTPVQLAGLEGFAAVYSDAMVTLGIKDNGEVWILFGLSDNYMVRQPTKMEGITGIDEIAVGGQFVTSRKNDGTVWSMGSNYLGQLGDGTTADRAAAPVQAEALTNVTDISAGYWHSLAITADGKVWGWGSGKSDQLGELDEDFSKVPIEIAGRINDLTGEDIPASGSAVQQLTLAMGESANIIASVSNMADIQNKTFQLSYSDADLELIDLCALTAGRETGVGAINGYPVEIVAVTPGQIQFKFTEAVSESYFSGVLNVFAVKARAQVITEVALDVL